MEKSVNNNLFSDVYKGTRVLVTGHTGFKGSWLSLWLLNLGAEVAGFSLYLPSDPCHFSAIGLRNKINHYTGDIRNIYELRKVFKDFKPEIVFHLAAQSIIRTSYDEPKITFDTNAGGTVNVMECIRKNPSVKAAVIITSDKCYENIEQKQGYREADRLGGKDPYSASKACAENICRAYTASYFNTENSPRIVTARAANVIGGGDWAANRVVPDCVRALMDKKNIVIRSPESIRPWQYVLEPLSGYLWIGACLIKKLDTIAGEAFNFGPDDGGIKSVRELAEAFIEIWGCGGWDHVPSDHTKKESVLLRLCSDKALHKLGWRSVLSFTDNVKLTAEWYRNYYDKAKDSYDLSCSQIDSYIIKAAERDAPWLKKCNQT